MTLLDALRYSLRSVGSRALESLLVVLGLALGVGAIAGTLVLAALAKDETAPGKDALIVRVEITDPQRHLDLPVRLVDAGRTREELLSVEDLGAAKAASPAVAHAFLLLFLPSDDQNGKEGLPSVAAVLGDYFEAFGMVAAEGALFSSQDQESGARVAVLGARRARLQFPDGGALGSTVTVLGVEYRVVGVLSEPALRAVEPPEGERGKAAIGPQDVAFIPMKSSIIFEKARYMDRLDFMARDVASVREAGRQLQTFFEGRLGKGSVDITTRAQEADQEAARMRAVILVLLTFAGTALLIATINVLNVLLARAARRVRSTGIAVALGSTRWGVFRQYLLESAALGLAGGAVGVPIAFGFAALIGVLFASGPGDPAPVVTLAELAPALSAAIGLNLVLGAYPAWRASRLNAADAVRAE